VLSDLLLGYSKNCYLLIAIICLLDFTQFNYLLNLLRLHLTLFYHFSLDCYFLKILDHNLQIVLFKLLCFESLLMYYYQLCSWNLNFYFYYLDY